MKSNKLYIGRIVKPQGIKGEVKLSSYVDHIQGVLKIKSLFIDGVGYEIVKARVVGFDAFLLLKGVQDRNMAEELRGKEVYIPFEQADYFRQEDYFVDELIGLQVYVGDSLAGEISAVQNYGSASVFEVNGEHPFMIPFLEKLVLKVDIQNNSILFDKKVFEEVVCYEN